MKKIIGITGTLGAGKTTIIECLKEFGFKHFSMREYLAKKIRAEGNTPNRDTYVEMGNRVRAEMGEDYPKLLLQQEGILDSGDNWVIESVRTPTEVQFFKNEPNAYLMCVDAPQQVRYERIYERGSETDKISFEEFVQNEDREMHNTDPNKQNLAYCMEHADQDLKFYNDGTPDELKAAVIHALAKKGIVDAVTARF